MTQVQQTTSQSNVDFNAMGGASINDDQLRMNSGAGAAYASVGQAQPSNLAAGFGNSINPTRSRGDLIMMKAKADDSQEPTTDIEATNEEKPAAVDQAEINKKNFKPGYAYFVLFIVLACRIMVQWHRKGLTYAYGYTGLGEAANNPIYEISTAYPELK